MVSTCLLLFRQMLIWNALKPTNNSSHSCIYVQHLDTWSPKWSIFHWNILSATLVITCIYLRNKFRHTYLCDYQHRSIKLTNYSLKKILKIKALQTVGANYLLGGKEQEGWMLLRVQENLLASASRRKNQSSEIHLTALLGKTKDWSLTRTDISRWCCSDCGLF